MNFPKYIKTPVVVFEKLHACIDFVICEILLGPA